MATVYFRSNCCLAVVDRIQSTGIIISRHKDTQQKDVIQSIVCYRRKY